MTTQKFNTANIDDSPYYQNVIKNYQRAIEILQDAPYVQKYLAIQSQMEHEEILWLRLHIDWFDCAISMLQEEEIFYLEEVKQKAIYYLNRYYRPQIKLELDKDPSWRWLMQQDNQITKGFFQTYSNGIIPMYPVKQGAAAGLYQMGSNYAELLLPIPVSEGEIEINVPLRLSIAFRWTDEKMWGEINIRVNSEKILSKTQKHFLTLFRVDLNYSQSIEKNLIVNAYGKFFVSNDFNQMNVIKEFLNNKKLHCTLKLHA
ncbi:hypothetical protein [Candidatus Uabimicrobium amorphum]|uniref:Uncharacterized protein n=1 Tax=Uabimicrobium amorphum TaxID=2596890 RepID=A0A5S9IL91_UABAM|nr:hypothetical protein [Candidatus Uabimicrobium amorphum]BBM83958.1 hypothetical protein UABAM_02313 [Candidatus Uabimicrobium amorphum]